MVSFICKRHVKSVGVVVVVVFGLFTCTVISIANVYSDVYFDPCVLVYTSIKELVNIKLYITLHYCPYLFFLLKELISLFCAVVIVRCIKWELTSSVVRVIFPLAIKLLMNLTCLKVLYFLA